MIDNPIINPENLISSEEKYPEYKNNKTTDISDDCSWCIWCDFDCFFMCCLG